MNNTNNTTRILNSSCILNFSDITPNEDEQVSSEYYSDKYEKFREHLLLHTYGLVNVIVGAGDTVHDEITNVQKFGSFFDIFICVGENVKQLEENVNYLNTHFLNQKLICILDVSNKRQLNTFVNLFSGRVSYLDFDDTLWSYFTPKITRTLLCPSHTPSLYIEEYLRLIRANKNTLSNIDKLKYDKYITSPPDIPAGVILLGSKLRPEVNLYDNMTTFTNAQFRCVVPTATSKVRELSGVVYKPTRSLYECTDIKGENYAGGRRRSRKHYKRRRACHTKKCRH
jgi:hypothetical protein